jgi:predicted nucleic acid-binding protein
MVIACDTSFLLSLYGSDAHSSRAVSWVARNTRPVHLNRLTRFEFENALRFSEFRKVIQPRAASLYLAGFEAAITQGRLIVVASNLADVVDEARRISSIRTLTGGHRGFDLLHVASALQLEATHFLTFDRNQRGLAKAEGLVVPL